MKNILYILLVIATISCTKEIEDDIFEGIDVESLAENPETDDPEIDPETGEPIDNEDDPEIDPITGEPVEDPEENNPDEEEIDPNLSGENTITDWQILDGSTLLSPANQITEGNVFAVELSAGTNITNISIQFSLPENATVSQSTTGLNFTTNDGVKVFDIVAENGEIKTYAFEVSLSE